MGKKARDAHGGGTRAQRRHVGHERRRGRLVEELGLTADFLQPPADTPRTPRRHGQHRVFLDRTGVACVGRGPGASRALPAGVAEHHETAIVAAVIVAAKVFSWNGDKACSAACAAARTLSPEAALAPTSAKRPWRTARQPDGTA